MEKVDVLIIGAGVIGLAIAREISSIYDRDILVVDKNKSFGQETSSRNSEVIHGGIYYPPNSLKAKFCVNGRHLLYELCEKENIPFRKIGKCIVATNKDELIILEDILRQGRENGVEGLRFLSSKEMAEKEPNVTCVGAIYSPETGIIDSHKFMVCLAANAGEKGVCLVYNAEVYAIEKSAHGYKVTIKNAEEIVDLESPVVINCAGLDADNIAEMVGIDVGRAGYTQYYCKGQYFRVAPSKCKLVNGLVYPVPRHEAGGLGVHATLDLAGSLRLGPDSNYLDDHSQNYSVDGNKREYFFDSAVKFLPFLKEEDLTPDSSGIRPKLQAEGGDFRDFIIRNEKDKGFPGFINLIGIESPGLTASIAIAKKVFNMINH